MPTSALTALTTMITHHEIDDTTKSLMTVLNRHHDNLQYIFLPQHIARDAHKTRLKGFILFNNKTISDGGITVDFSIIKVHTSN